MTTLFLVAVAWLASSTPGLAPALQYERAAVDAGQTWRVLTGQLVHWTPQMTCADLGVLALAGLWLEWRAPRVAAATIVAGLLAVGCAVHAAGPGSIDIFRGSSGVGTAVFAAAAVVLGRTQPRTAWTLLALLVGKLAAETVRGGAGAALLADTLPPDVIVATRAHVAGAAAGAIAAIGLPFLARRDNRAHSYEELVRTRAGGSVGDRTGDGCAGGVANRSGTPRRGCGRYDPARSAGHARRHDAAHVPGHDTA